MQPSGTSVEHWRPIAGFEGVYDISDHGRIWSRSRPGKPKGQYLKLSGTPPKYQAVSLFRFGHGRTKAVHLLVLETFVGPRPEGMQACHNDGNSANNHVTNLRWDTVKGNGEDRVLHGTSRRAGSHCPKGHVLDPPNLRALAVARGWHLCLTCHRVRGQQAADRAAGKPEREFDDLAVVVYADVMANDGVSTLHQGGRSRCLNGHPLTPPNLFPGAANDEGKRKCVACGRARSRFSYLRRKGRPLPLMQEEADRQYERLLREAGVN